ncbi:bifunctional UDP-sugar hydrolase/5'-nucleotidase [Saxibacter everestensis]|uniref:Bifunctional UDP-sugar hydrolase/5'-nucleotidase n=1 Tax=Saxibacter everestensis TaxID=2909229 RepID=A0ABY8QXI6_9MICO|nr:bifunctional UDP-sugar hydrolase/5'-nucleotidase [Brevibacteriaceae bacterium ZFBP1038]
MPRYPLGRGCALAVTALIAGSLATPALAVQDPAAVAAPEGTKLQLLNINDFHGRIAESSVALARTVQEQRGNVSNTAFLSAGDNIGASTYVSSSQGDKPTIDILNALQLNASAVGNHEFDKGTDDLTGRVASAADFDYLGANVYKKGTSQPALDPYALVTVGDVDVAVIGVVTRETASLVSPGGIEDIEFGAPVPAINKTVEELNDLPEAEQPDAIVLQAHAGATESESDTTLEEQLARDSEFADIVKNSSADVDAIFTGHTHKEYAWQAPVADGDRTRPVVQTGEYGNNLGQIVLESNGDGSWDAATVKNLPTKDSTFSDPTVKEVESILADAEAKAEETGSVKVGAITEDIKRAETSDGKENRGAESTLGNLVADALKAGIEDSPIAEADFGITNPGGLRDDLLYDGNGEVTVAELNAVLPFANQLGVVSMRGADVIGLFEEQWQPEGSSRPFLHLGISEQLNVVYDSAAEKGKRVVSVEVNGEKIDPSRTYRVATLSFLATGGDNFGSFTKGTWEDSGTIDFDAWRDYFAAESPVSPDKQERQADTARDIIATKKLDARVTSEGKSPTIEAGEPAEFAFNATATEDLPDGYTLTADAPEGFSIAIGQPGKSADRAAGDSAELPDGFTRGENTLPITVTPGDGVEPGSYTLRFSLALRPDQGPFFDNNPLPLPRSVSIDVDVVPADGPGDSEGGTEGSTEGSDSTGDSEGETQGSTEGGDSAGDSEGGTEGSTEGGDSGTTGSETSADGRDEDLPRTGSDVSLALGLSGVLLLAGAVALLIARRRNRPQGGVIR